MNANGFGICFFVLLGSILFAGCGSPPRVEFVERPTQIDVLIGDQLFTSYRFEETLTKPVLYPLRTPGGVAVNRRFPIEQDTGETTDHPHHIGIFFTYDKVNGVGFWGNKTSPPQIRHIKALESRPGDGKGVLRTLCHWVDTQSNVLLQENRAMTFEVLPEGWAIDFDITLTAQDQKITFEDTKEGMFALRLADPLRGVAKGGTSHYLNNHGLKEEQGVWGKRAVWVRLEGVKNEKSVGVAMFNLPGSTNFPTYWHARDYGLFAANPLGQYDFQKANQEPDPKPLELTLAPGQSARFRFFVLLYDGTRSPDQLDKVFLRYSRD